MSDIRMTKVDAEGVPRMVQRVEYLYDLMAYEATLFNGSKVLYATDFVSPTVRLDQTVTTPEQDDDAMAKIETTVTDYWRELCRY